MFESQKKELRYDPFNGDIDVLSKIVDIGIQISEEKHRSFF